MKKFLIINAGTEYTVGTHTGTPHGHIGRSVGRASRYHSNQKSGMLGMSENQAIIHSFIPNKKIIHKSL